MVQPSPLPDRAQHAVKECAALVRPENFTRVLQLRDAGAGAVFILLSGAAADAAGTLDDAIADDRNRSLAHDHMAALCRGKPA
jgi:hypothetical protein